MVSNETPITVGFLLQQCLDIVVKEDSLEKKYEKGTLIKKLVGVTKLDDLEIATLKEGISRSYGPYLIKLLFDILDGKGK